MIIGWDYLSKNDILNVNYTNPTLGGCVVNEKQ